MVGRLLRLLDECVQHDYAPPDEKTIERPADTRATARPQLEQTIAERSRIRQLQVGAMLDQQFDDSRVVRENIDRPGFDLGQHSGMEVLNRKCHGRRLAIMRTLVNPAYVDIGSPSGCLGIKRGFQLADGGKIVVLVAEELDDLDRSAEGG